MPRRISRETYYYGACVDSVDNESDTGNNCFTLAGTIEVVAALSPDLIVSDLTIDEGNTLTAGQDITLSATVRRTEVRANRIARRSDTISLPMAPFRQTILKSETDNVKPLTHNETDDKDIDLVAPNQPGTYYYGACADGVVNESDAANNCLVFSVTVQEPGKEPPVYTLLKKLRRLRSRRR